MSEKATVTYKSGGEHWDKALELAEEIILLVTRSGTTESPDEAQDELRQLVDAFDYANVDAEKHGIRTHGSVLVE